MSKWTAQDDAALQQLETRGWSAAEIGDHLGRTRSAVLGRSNRLRGTQFPSVEIRREREHADSVTNAAQKQKIKLSAIDHVRHLLSTGLSREEAIVRSRIKGASFAEIGTAIGVSRQRVQQLFKQSSAS